MTSLAALKLAKKDLFPKSFTPLKSKVKMFFFFYPAFIPYLRFQYFSRFKMKCNRSSTRFALVVQQYLGTSYSMAIILSLTFVPKSSASLAHMVLAHL